MAAPARLGVTMPVEDGLALTTLVDLVVEAETLGYDTALVGEVAGPEAMATMGLWLGRTASIRVGSGIVAAYTRSPALAAMGFATLNSYAPSRVVAGVGASSPIVVGRWHGIEFARPLAKTSWFVRELKRALGGERLDGGFKLAFAPQRVPVWLAAINPKMLELAGEIADGVFLTWCPPDEAPAKIEIARAAAQRSGRDPDEIEVILSFWGYAGDRPELALERMRRSVLAYAMVPTHQAAFVAAFPSLGAAADAWAAGDRKAALALVSDEVVHAQCAIGADAIAARVARYRAAGVDTPVILLTGAEPGDAEGPAATMRAAAGR